MLKPVLIVISILSLVYLNPVHAQLEPTPSYKLKSSFEEQETNPGMPNYNIKRLLEKISERILFMSDSKISYVQKLLKRRFSELKFIVENKNLDEVQKASERFAYQAGILTELVTEKPQKEKQRVIALFKNYKDDLNVLKFNFELDSSYWILMLHDINTLDSLTARLTK